MKLKITHQVCVVFLSQLKCLDNLRVLIENNEVNLTLLCQNFQIHGCSYSYCRQLYVYLSRYRRILRHYRKFQSLAVPLLQL